MKALFGAGKAKRNQDEQRSIGRKGVVLLIGRKRKEDHKKRTENRKDQDRLLLRGAWLREVAAMAPCFDQSRRSEQAPREQPYQVENPVPKPWQLVVIAGNAAAEKAQKVLVDEVEPEEAVAIGASRIPQP